MSFGYIVLRSVVFAQRSLSKRYILIPQIKKLRSRVYRFAFRCASHKGHFQNDISSFGR
ncbi:hypothetical protein KNP414_02991 [Paenibacillus mucilaginosus KNP414]|uniref:Uncharacterized protein n=1 Tax=Paenibacillus mucilaginosus (strain KNP414) TaxID=1036673 RepID=F8F8G1_PAEMK|nr:hypothetical protein KNP414_02991 [Paenibacillus mucilaginosus KNP414]